VKEQYVMRVDYLREVSEQQISKQCGVWYRKVTTQFRSNFEEGVFITSPVGEYCQSNFMSGVRKMYRKKNY